MSISLGDTVSLADFPGGDRPMEFRHERHDQYSGETPGYPGVDFHVVEPLTWQGEDGRWMTRLHRRGEVPEEDGYLPGFLRKACGEDCPRTKRDEKGRKSNTCDCARQLHVSLVRRGGRKGEEAYSRICGWIKDGMVLPRRFSSEQWLRRKGADRVEVHHERPPVEQESEFSVRWVKDDSKFSGLYPCTPAEHREWHRHAAADPGVPAPAPVCPVPAESRSPSEKHVDQLIQEGIRRGRPPGRKSKRSKR